MVFLQRNKRILISWLQSPPVMILEPPKIKSATISPYICHEVMGLDPILWPPHAKSGLIGKDPAAGRDWGQEEKGTTEDEVIGWHE